MSRISQFLFFVLLLKSPLRCWSLSLLLSYSQGFETCLPCTQQENSIRLARGKRGACFNCLRTNHSLKDCPEPIDRIRIAENRREFQEQSQTPTSMRYHRDDSMTKPQTERFSHIKAGQISEALRAALGLSSADIPVHVYRMRSLGYPPGYQMAERMGQRVGMPSLQLYDSEGRAATETSVVESSTPSTILYPGFNAPSPWGTIDRWRELGYPAPRHMFQEAVGRQKRQHSETEAEREYPSSKRRPPSDSGMDLDQEQDADLEEGELLESTSTSPNVPETKPSPVKGEKSSEETDGPSKTDDEEEEVKVKPSPAKKWSTDFPPDMAPVDQELKHRWLTLQTIVKKSARKSRKSL